MTADSYLDQQVTDISKIVPAHGEALARHGKELKDAYQLGQERLLASIGATKNPVSLINDHLQALQDRQKEIKAQQQDHTLAPLHRMSYRASNALREYELRLTQDFIRECIPVLHKYEAALAKQLEGRDIQTDNVVETVAATPAAPWINTVPTEVIELGADDFEHPVLRAPLGTRTQAVEDVGSPNAAAERAVYRVVDSIDDLPPAPAPVVIPASVVEPAQPTAPLQRDIPEGLATSRWGPPALERRTQAIDAAYRATKDADLPAFVDQIKTEQRATMLELTARHAAGTLREPDTQFVFDYSEFLKRQIKSAERRIENATPIPKAERWSYQDMTDRLDKIEDALKIKSGDELFVFTRDILMPEYKAAKEELMIRVAAGTDKTPESNALADYGVSLLNGITRAKAQLTPAAERVEAFHQRMAQQQEQPVASMFQRATSAVANWLKPFRKQKPDELLSTIGREDRLIAPVMPVPDPARIHLDVARLAMRDQLAAEGLAPKSRWTRFGEAASSFGKLLKGGVDHVAEAAGNRISRAVHWTSERAAPVTLGVVVAAAGGVAALSPKSPDVTSLADKVVAQQKADAKAEAEGRRVTGVVDYSNAASSVPAPIIIVTEGTPSAPAAAPAEITVAKAETKPAKASFAAATNAPSFKPAASLTYTFKDGSTSRFSAETWNKVCDQLKDTGTPNTICAERGLNNG